MEEIIKALKETQMQLMIEANDNASRQTITVCPMRNMPSLASISIA